MQFKIRLFKINKSKLQKKSRSTVLRKKLRQFVQILDVENIGDKFSLLIPAASEKKISRKQLSSRKIWEACGPFWFAKKNIGTICREQRFIEYEYALLHSMNTYNEHSSHLSNSYPYSQNFLRYLCFCNFSCFYWPKQHTFAKKNSDF